MVRLSMQRSGVRVSIQHNEPNSVRTTTASDRSNLKLDPLDPALRYPW